VTAFTLLSEWLLQLVSQCGFQSTQSLGWAREAKGGGSVRADEEGFGRLPPDAVKVKATQKFVGFSDTLPFDASFWLRYGLRYLLSLMSARLKKSRP